MLFLSYSRGDSIAAHSIANALRAAGQPVWLDTSHLDLTRDIEPQIYDAIGLAVAILHLDSEHSRRSSWVSLERAMAQRLNKPIFDVPTETLLHFITQLPAHPPLNDELCTMRFLNFMPIVAAAS